MEGGVILKKRLYRLLCFVCAFTILLSLMMLPTWAEDQSGKKASVFAYALNDEMIKSGVITTIQGGECIAIDRAAGIYPSGVIYADMIDFDHNESPYLVIWRSDAERGCISVDIYKYDAKTREAVLAGIISKGYNIGDGISGEIAIGFNETQRYLVYNEYLGADKIKSEYFTVVNGTAFQFIDPPEYGTEAGVASFTKDMLRPEVDTTFYNHYLGEFFSGLKNASANSVTYEDIADVAVSDEIEKIEKTLSDTVGLGVLDIGGYTTLEKYNKALERTTTDDKFYSITNLYELGEQLYYVRFATNRSFYNYAILRRTPALENSYQLLCIRCDSIPLSDRELEGLKEAYTHNKLVMKKARGTIVEKSGSIFGSRDKSGNTEKEQANKPFTAPKLISSDLRKPVGFIGGGVCLVLFVIFWIYIASDE